MTSAASPLRPGALGTQARAFEEEADESRAWSGENSPDDEGLVSTSPTGKMAPGSGRATVTPRDPADPFITHCPLEVALSESPSRGRGSVTNMAERSTDSRVPLFSGLGYRKRWGGAGEPSPFSLRPLPETGPLRSTAPAVLLVPGESRIHAAPQPSDLGPIPHSCVSEG